MIQNKCLYHLHLFLHVLQHVVIKHDYEEIVKILLESHLVEFDGINHECILNHVLGLYA